MAVEVPGGILKQSDVRETITNTEETSVGWDLDYARYKQRFNTTLADAIRGIYISPDGFNIYIGTSGATDYVHQFTLGNAWDISTASLTHSLNINDKETAITGVHFRNDGLKMYIAGGSGKVHEYDLSPAWTLSTATYLRLFDFTAQVAGTDTLYIREDGKQFFIGSGTNAYSYTIITAWDISSAEYIETKALAGTIVCMDFSSDGAYMFFGDNASHVDRWALSTVFILSTAASDKEYTVAPAGNPLGLAFKLNGSKMYLVVGAYIWEYTIKRGWR